MNNKHVLLLMLIFLATSRALMGGGGPKQAQKQLVEKSSSVDADDFLERSEKLRLEKLKNKLFLTEILSDYKKMNDKDLIWTTSFEKYLKQTNPNVSMKDIEEYF